MLVNRGGSSTTTVSLGGTFASLWGGSASAVTLEASDGAIFLK